MHLRIILLVSILCAQITVAQNPGYQGRRFSLNYNLNFFNALNNPNAAGQSGWFSFNTAHYGMLDATVSKRISLGVSFRYLRTAFKFDESFEVPVIEQYSMTSKNVTSSSIGVTESYSVGIYGRFFFRGNIAPLGTYWKPGIDLVFYKVYPGHPEPRFCESCAEPYFRNWSPYKTLALSLELGQNRILFDRLFIDYGVRLALYPFLGPSSQNTTVDNDTYLKVVPLKRIAAHDFFNVKLGVGVLLF